MCFLSAGTLIKSTIVLLKNEKYEYSKEGDGLGLGGQNRAWSKSSFASTIPAGQLHAGSLRS